MRVIHCGAEIITEVDLNDDKAKMAKKCSMTHFVKLSKPPGGQSETEAIIELTKTEKSAFGDVYNSFNVIGNAQVMHDTLD
ncbi:S-(hydroxymethyl)glutathione dehydrogenase [Sulfitobacter sp. DSM 110093]|uniref:hypothetical protein n=1 Tax=Sulfitobacter sp. DSM 110093 TaxID=2883127 RepID=UPI001FACEECC|nr:hypothetical protein [Sulfitobacter sp. DSM 110093]UOA32871.1 S-(hydroxymethyl)glutathione dehydrogenase [Sulfitobacter sp. DSM 110093]